MVSCRTWIGSLLLASPVAAQTTIHVPADSPTIQGAIDLAQDGDTVLVAPGTYDEELDYLGKAITLRSEAGPAATTLTNVNSAVSFVNGEGPGSVLRGFVVTGLNGSSRSAIYCPGATPLIQHCVIRANQTSIGLASGIWGDATVEDCAIVDNVSFIGPGGVAGALTLRRCVLRGNHGYDSAAVYLTGGGLEDCRIVENSAEDGSDGGAVTVRSNAVVVLERCVIAHNTKDTFGGSYSARGVGVKVDGSSAPVALVNCTIVDNHVITPGFYDVDCGGVHGAATLVSCIVYGNDGVELVAGKPSYCDVDGGAAGRGNFSADPLLRDAQHGDYRLQPGSPCIDTGNPLAAPDPDGSQADVGVETYAHASTFLLLGSGANPLLLVGASPPAIGTSWHTAIVASLVPGTTISGLQLRSEKLAAPLVTPFGEVLVSGARLAAVQAPSNGLLDPFSFAIPSDLALLGDSFYAQGFVVASPGGARLGNGLAVVVGE